METLSESTNTEQIEDVAVELVEPVKKEKKTRTKGFKFRKNKVEAKIVELAAKQVPVREIAKIVGQTPRIVEQKILEFRKVFKELESINVYNELKTDILDAAQLAALKSALDPKNLDNTSMLNGAKAFDIFNKANRLERNQTTSNSAIGIFGRIGLSPSSTPPTDPE